MSKILEDARKELSELTSISFDRSTGNKVDDYIEAITAALDKLEALEDTDVCSVYDYCSDCGEFMNIAQACPRCGHEHWVRGGK